MFSTTNNSKISTRTESKLMKPPKNNLESMSSKTEPKVKSEKKEKTLKIQTNPKKGIRTHQNYIKGALEELDDSLRKADMMVNQLRWSVKCLSNAMSIYSSFLRYKVNLKCLEAVMLDEAKNDNFFHRFRVLDQEILKKISYQKVNWRYLKNLHHHFRAKVMKKFNDLHNFLLLNYSRNSNLKNGDIFVELDIQEENQFNLKLLDFVIFF